MQVLLFTLCVWCYHWKVLTSFWFLHCIVVVKEKDGDEVHWKNKSMPWCLWWKVFRKQTAMKSEGFFFVLIKHLSFCNVGPQSSQLVAACINIDLVPENQWPVCNPAVDTTALLKYKSNILKLAQLLCLWYRLACIVGEQSSRCCSHVSLFLYFQWDVVTPGPVGSSFHGSSVCLFACWCTGGDDSSVSAKRSVWQQHPGCWLSLLVCASGDGPRGLAVYSLPFRAVPFPFF